MKIGYPCINLSLKCRSSKTFRLKSYKETLLIEKIRDNLNCLWEILRYNVKHNILFFRISSDLIPFASHPVCKFKWQTYFKKQFTRIGRFIKDNKIRISMHPDQFTLINSPDKNIFGRSKRELVYHAQVLDLMNLTQEAKIQIHVGGVYGDKDRAMARFIRRFWQLPFEVRRRLVVENDDKSYTVENCLAISRNIKIPVLFDFFHHRINPADLSLERIFKLVAGTWKRKDGCLMVDYSSQQKGKPAGSHAASLNSKDFQSFLRQTKAFDFDLMLEIKDKEKSALKVIEMVRKERK